MSWSITPLRVRGGVPWFFRPGAVVGELVFDDAELRQHECVRTTVHARSLGGGADMDLLPALNQAKIVRLDGEGLTIEGTEIFSRGARLKAFPQTWRCEPIPSLAGNTPVSGVGQPGHLPTIQLSAGNSSLRAFRGRRFALLNLLATGRRG